MTPEAGKEIDFKGFGGGKTYLLCWKIAGKGDGTQHLFITPKKILNSRTVSAYWQQRETSCKFYNWNVISFAKKVPNPLCQGKENQSNKKESSLIAGFTLTIFYC